jgi:hypothetical protein
MEEKSKKQYAPDEWEQWGMKNWRAWGSWFSWGSPVGLALGYAIVMLATGGFMYLTALASHVK